MVLSNIMMYTFGISYNRPSTVNFVIRITETSAFNGVHIMCYYIIIIKITKNVKTLSLKYYYLFWTCCWSAVTPRGCSLAHTAHPQALLSHLMLELLNDLYRSYSFPNSQNTSFLHYLRCYSAVILYYFIIINTNNMIITLLYCAVLRARTTLCVKTILILLFYRANGN